MTDTIIIKRDTTYDILYLILSCFFLSFIYGGVWLLIPFLNGTVAFGISLIILFMSFNDRQLCSYFIKKQYAAGFLALPILSFIYMLTEDEKFSSSHFLSVYYCLIIILIAAHYGVDKDRRKYFLGIVLIEIVIMLAANIFYTVQDPEIIRSSQLETYTVYGTGFQKMVKIQILYIVAVLCFVFVSNFRVSKHKIFAVIFVVGSLWLLYEAQLTLVLLTTFVLMIYILLINPRYLKISVITGIILLVFLLVFSENILDFIIDNGVFGKSTTNRLEEVRLIFFNDRSFSQNIKYFTENQYFYRSSSTIGRLVAYTKSFSALFHNFFLGVWTPGALKNGGHSIWLDLISQYGIGVILAYRAFIKYARSLLNTTDIYNKKAVLCFIIAFVFLGVFNNFSLSHFCIMLYIILPYMNEIISKNRVMENEGSVDN